jgi:DNA-binding protein Alba
MEKYTLVKKPKDPENEVRIKNKYPMTDYVDYIISQFIDKNANEVAIKSTEDEISKIITIAEIIKHRVKGLHQVNNIGTQDIEDVYEPIEEGLDKLTF